jgi:PAS domain S-box-containing protein
MLIPLIAVFVIAMLPHAVLSSGPKRKPAVKPEILVLESYHPTHPWADRVTQGMLDYFKKSKKYNDCKFYFEYLDSKRHIGTEHLKIMADTLRHKYSKRKQPFDLVIVLDDNALNFLFEEGKTLFKNAPVVFCSVSCFDQSMRGQRQITGLVERIYPLQTVLTALKMKPGTRNLLIISDNITTTSKVFRRQTSKELAGLNKRIKIEYLPKMTLNELKQKLSQMPSDSIILLLNYSMDRNHRIISSLEAARMISDISNVPVFGVAKYYIGNGIVGGMLKDGYKEGEDVARLSMKVLSGENPNLLPIRASLTNHLIFDADELARLKIPRSNVPDNASIVNIKRTFIEKYREWIIIILAIILVEALIIGTLLVNRRKFLRSRIELAEVNENFSLFLSQLPASAMICSRQGEFLLANHAAERMFKVSSTEGLTLEDVCSEEFITEFHRLRGRSMCDGEAEFTYPGAISHNPEMIIRGTIFPLFRSDSNPVFGCIFSDVTRRVKDEIEIEDRSRRIQLATDAAGLEFWDWVISENVLYPVANREGGEANNKILRSSINNWTEAIHHQDRRMVKSEINRCFERPDQTFSAEFRFKDANSKWQWVSAVGIISERNEKNRPVRMAGCFREITTSKQSEEMLKQTQFAVDSAPEEIYYLDADGDFVYVNDYICRKTGYTRETLLTKNIRDVNPFFRIDDNWQEHWNKIRRQQLLVQETIHTSQDGNEYPVEADFYMVKSGNQELVCVCARDVTVQKRYEAELVEARDQAEESNRLKSAFLANISHEIRTPLNSIVGFSQLLSNKDLSEEERNRYLDLINGGSRQLMTMIADILDLSRLESGELEVFPVPTKVKDVLEEVYEHFDLRLKNENRVGMEFHLDLQDNNLMVLADPDRLKQVISSLLDNAFKFTSRGHVRVGCRLKNDKILFYVEDTGCGISEEMSKNIFEQFRQGSLSFTNKYRGIGIGLALCQELVEKMFGTISFKSFPDEGTTFSVELPAAVQGTVSAKEINDKIPTWPERTILIVDDNVDVRIFLQALLSVTSCKLIVASSGMEAVELCAQHKEINVVLLDLNMPKMSGIDTAAEIKKMRPDLPIIAQTAYYAPSEGRALLDQGFDGFLTKPIERDGLFAQLTKFIA